MKQQWRNPCLLGNGCVHQDHDPLFSGLRTEESAASDGEPIWRDSFFGSGSEEEAAETKASTHNPNRER